MTLYDILANTTKQFRKGDEIRRKVNGNVEVVTIDAMPHESSANGLGLELVDLHFITVGVHKAQAEAYRADLLAALRDYPEPERLKDGPSYIEVGASIGDQGAALALFALGKVLGLWDVITPARLGVTGPKADELAGSGFVMMTGYDVGEGVKAAL